MRIFEFENYRPFLLAKIRDLPSEGKGELSKIARTLQISNSFLSQVLQGKKDFSLDHIFILSKYYNLAELEYKYFVELVNLERANHHELKSLIKKQMQDLREKATALSGVTAVGQPLDEKNQAVFYSSWQQSAVQLVTGIDGFHTAEAISKRFKIDGELTRKILNFLVEVGLCVRKGNHFTVGTRRTHLDKTSPLRSRHHANWRLKAMEQFNNNSHDEIFFTFPMRIDGATSLKIKEYLQNLIEEVDISVAKSGNEILSCLNIDFFNF